MLPWENIAIIALLFVAAIAMILIAFAASRGI
jgi:hypothetical protein